MELGLACVSGWRSLGTRLELVPLCLSVKAGVRLELVPLCLSVKAGVSRACTQQAFASVWG